MGFLGRWFRASGVGRWKRLVCEWESCGEGSRGVFVLVSTLRRSQHSVLGNKPGGP
jgi:hypothetical protein